MSKYDTDVGHAWSVAYGAPHADSHMLFATLLGIGRKEAKEKCFEYIWSPEGREVFAIQKIHQAEANTVFVYKFFADMMKRAGLDIAVPELQEIFNMMEDE